MDNKSISSDLIRGHIDTIILYSLMDGKKTSQQIIDSVDIKSGGKYQLNQATLYSSLKRLESLKFISSVWNDSAEGRRKFFTLTLDGEKTVTENLHNWEYSRAIIDQLIGFNAPNERVVEKIVEKPVYVEKVIEKPIEVIKTVEVKPAVSPTPTITDDTSEINFRNILNGLIKATEIKSQTETIEVSVAEDASEKKNFNETINDVERSFVNTTNKIDFSEIKEKVESQGYKLNISSKESVIKSGNVYINRINACSALIMCLVALIEFLTFSMVNKNDIAFSALSVFSVVAAVIAYPVVSLILLIKKPRKTTEFIKKDGILTAAIIAFNLILFTVVIGLLLNVDYSLKYNLSIYLILPILLIFDFVLFFVIRYIFSRAKTFIVKDRK